MPSSKVATMRDAIAELVRDGDTVAIEGFTHLISFAAGHEIIRQRKRELTLARLTPDVIYDQMIAGGVASKLVFSWLGTPGVGGLGAFNYAPPIARLFGMFGALEWLSFLWIWLSLLLGTVIWLGGRGIRVLWLLAFPPVALEIYHGNVPDRAGDQG